MSMDYSLTEIITKHFYSVESMCNAFQYNNRFVITVNRKLRVTQ